MIIDIYTKNPDGLLALITESVSGNKSPHMELWELVSEKGVDFLTLRDIKYFYKVLLKPEVIEGIKVRFTFEFHEYSDHRLSVKAEYVGKFTECIIYHFVTEIRGIQVFPV